MFWKNALESLPASLTGSHLLDYLTKLESVALRIHSTSLWDSHSTGPWVSVPSHAHGQVSFFFFFERQLIHELVHSLAKSDLFGGFVYLSVIHLSICLFENAMTLCNYKDPLSQAIELDRPRWEMMEAIQIHTYGEPEGTKTIPSFP